MVRPTMRANLTFAKLASQRKPCCRRGGMCVQGTREATHPSRAVGMLSVRQRTCICLCASDAFVLQDPDYDPAVLGLALCGCVGSYLLARAHSTGGQDIRQRNVSLLFKKLEHVVCTLHAEFLVQRSAAHFRCIPLHLNDIGSDSLGF